MPIREPYNGQRKFVLADFIKERTTRELENKTALLTLEELNGLLREHLPVFLDMAYRQIRSAELESDIISPDSRTRFNPKDETEEIRCAVKKENYLKIVELRKGETISYVKDWDVEMTGKTESSEKKVGNKRKLREGDPIPWLKYGKKGGYELEEDALLCLANGDVVVLVKDERNELTSVPYRFCLQNLIETHN